MAVMLMSIKKLVAMLAQTHLRMEVNMPMSTPTTTQMVMMAATKTDTSLVRGMPMFTKVHIKTNASTKTNIDAATAHGEAVAPASARRTLLF